jgi:Fic family protein
MELIKSKGFLSTNMIIEIQQEIEGNRAGIRKLPGTTLANDKTGEIMYTPPDNETTIRNLLKNMEEFVNTDNDEIDPLVKLAMAHYQFEAIHPFYDGNGRTGRIINVLYLVLKDLLNEPFLYLSSYIIQNKSDYYKLLRGVTTTQNCDGWILFMLKAVEKTAEKTLLTSENIVAIIDKNSKRIKKERSALYSKELVEVLFSNVYCKISHLVENGIASRNIASKYLKELESIGILKSEKIGREIIYINKELYELLKKA